MSFSYFVEIFTIFWFWMGLLITAGSICCLAECIISDIKKAIKNRRNRKMRNECYFYSQSDWCESDTESNTYIGKKPTIPPTISSEPKRAEDWEDVLRGETK